MFNMLMDSCPPSQAAGASSPIHLGVGSEEKIRLTDLRAVLEQLGNHCCHCDRWPQADTAR